ncbi:MAG: hypothetical protein K9W44_17385 [Candidatus Lokiarchaeota archaeon]|nr:hypothetical protein [Candidatus Harpocratesius repetitus]
MEAFLEISIISKSDKQQSDLKILNIVKENICNYAPYPPKRAKITKIPSVYLEFDSKNAFEALYEKDYLIYSYLYENILKSNLILNHNSLKNKDLTSNQVNRADFSHESSLKQEYSDNYIVFRYKTNYKEPLKRNYDLIYKVNEILGLNIVNEEIHDGFIRFIQTEKDFKALLSGNDDLSRWMSFLKTLNLNLEHPTVKKFLQIIEHTLNGL